MGECYVVVKTTGSDNDLMDQNISVWTTGEGAEKEIDRLVNLDIDKINRITKLNMEMDKWDKLNPRPEGAVPGGPVLNVSDEFRKFIRLRFTKLRSLAKQYHLTIAEACTMHERPSYRHERFRMDDAYIPQQVPPEMDE